MENITDCERFVIEKLIRILTKSLECQSSSLSFEGEGKSETSKVISDQSIVQKLLKVLLSQNETIDPINSGNAHFRNDFSSPNENSTESVILYSDKSNDVSGGIISSSGSNSATTEDDGSIMTNRLHKLELIKVFVLIFVISIILLTTCRMVFQLFIKFRPEKSPLA